MATTTQISTESKRPSLSQNIESLYENMHVGGAFDAKKDLVTNGSHNERVTSFQSRINTPKGFKTKMSERQTEFFMGNDNKVVTTTMRTSVYGDHSNKKYWNM
jgi:hypothetical protein